MSNKGLYTSGSTAVSSTVDSIPLHDTGVTNPGNDSIGTLISNASEQVSTLVRGEIELAKAEVMGSVKKGAVGGGLFGAAGVIALYATFFLFFALAEMLASWMHRGWAFLIVFLIMLALAGLLALIGFRSVKKIQAPKRTMESVNELKNLVPGQAQANLRKDETGLYTTAPVAAPLPPETRGAQRAGAERDVREVREVRTTTRTVENNPRVRRVTPGATSGAAADARRTGGSTAVTRD